MGSLRAADFEYVRTLAKSTAAIIIEADREYLVESRLGPLAEREGFRDIGNLVDSLRMQRDLSHLHLQVIDALTTNETLFFRDMHPFEALREQVIPDLLKQSIGRKLNIWSAACSTGQEPYSIAMLLKEKFPAVGASTVYIHATDLAERVLVQARSGSYSQLEVNRGLAAPFLVKYFRQQENRWIIRDDIRAMVSFNKMNLIQEWPSLPVFDLILIRNVLIYFDADAKRRILSNMVRHLSPNGYLLMGSAESPLAVCDELKPVTINKAILYRRV